MGSSRAAYGGQASRGGGENPARERGRLPEYEGGSCGGGPVPAVVEPRPSGRRKGQTGLPWGFHPRGPRHRFGGGGQPLPRQPGEGSRGEGGVPEGTLTITTTGAYPHRGKPPGGGGSWPQGEAWRPRASHGVPPAVQEGPSRGLKPGAGRRKGQELRQGLPGAAAPGSVVRSLLREACGRRSGQRTEGLRAHGREARPHPPPTGGGSRRYAGWPWKARKPRGTPLSPAPG